MRQIQQNLDEVPLPLLVLPQVECRWQHCEPFRRRGLLLQQGQAAAWRRHDALQPALYRESQARQRACCCRGGVLWPGGVRVRPCAEAMEQLQVVRRPSLAQLHAAPTPAMRCLEAPATLRGAQPSPAQLPFSGLQGQLSAQQGQLARTWLLTCCGALQMRPQPLAPAGRRWRHHDLACKECAAHDGLCVVQWVDLSSGHRIRTEYAGFVSAVHIASRFAKHTIERNRPADAEK